MYSGISSDCHRLRWLIVQARFPGFTAEVQAAFWRVIDDENIDVRQPHFEAALNRHFSADVDFSDNAAVSSEDQSDDTRLSNWAEKILAYYNTLDSAVDNGDVAWFSNHIPVIDREIVPNKSVSILEDRVRALEKEIKLYQDVSTNKSKRLGTLYKIILGLAFSKFRYSAIKKNSASSNIAKSLEGSCSVGAETVHNVLDDALIYLDIQNPEESISS